MALVSTGIGSSDYLKSLINAGADLYTNLYYVKFSGGVFDSANFSQMVAVRMNNFKVEVPTFSSPSTKSFMTTSVDMPTPFMDGNKSFTATLRLDENYNLYYTLQKQKAFVSIGSLGYVASDLNEKALFTAEVYAPADSIEDISRYTTETVSFFDKAKKLYTFKNCWIKSLSNPTNFGYSGSNPMETTMTVIFSEYEDPQYYAMIAKENK